MRLPKRVDAGSGDGRSRRQRADELLADFGSRGLWAYYNNTAPWVKLDARSPTSLLATDLDQNQKGREDVVAAFGSAGLWARYNNTGGFVQLRGELRGEPAQAIAAGGFN